MIPNAQPTLPAEAPLTDLENYFQSVQPAIWPTNQDSNLGLLRALLTGQLQEALDLVGELADESFIVTAQGYLGLWETELGLPKGQGGRSDLQRKSSLLSRREIGPFTRSRRNRVIERFIIETLGVAPSFTVSGLSLDGGITLLSDTASVSTLYRVVEDIENFHYTVYILNSVTPDLDSLDRELEHITPAHMSFSVDNSVTVLP